MNKINKFLKLASLIAKFASVETNKGTLTATDEIVEGVEVYVQNENDEFVPAPDDVYETETQLITVKDGKVEKIENKTIEEPLPEEFSRKMRFMEESYNQLMRKIQEAVGSDSYVVDAGDGWAVVVIYEDETEKTYRYTYSIDAEGNIILGEREEAEPRFVTKDEAQKLEFEEETPVDEVVPDEKDEKIKELETKITELEGLLQDRDAVIEELTAKIKELEDNAQAPVEEPVKMSATIMNTAKKDNPALKFFE